MYPGQDHLFSALPLSYSGIEWLLLIKIVDDYEASKLPGLDSNQHITPCGLSE